MQSGRVIAAITAIAAPRTAWGRVGGVGKTSRIVARRRRPLCPRRDAGPPGDHRQPLPPVNATRANVGLPRLPPVNATWANVGPRGWRRRHLPDRGQAAELTGRHVGGDSMGTGRPVPNSLGGS